MAAACITPVEQGGEYSFVDLYICLYGDTSSVYTFLFSLPIPMPALTLASLVLTLLSMQTLRWKMHCQDT